MCQSINLTLNILIIIIMFCKHCKRDVGSSNFEVYRMVRTVAAWLILAGVAYSVSCDITKNGSTSVGGKSYLSP